ncbi:MAG: hypothetical protein FJW39_19305 [Acidobacteria bacterium]|nr:hypothetical protein [Acidobacteriota bacterium]
MGDHRKGRGGRYRAVLRLPIYLEPEVQDYLAAKAQAKKIDLDDLVNDLLKQEIRIAESLRQPLLVTHNPLI